MSWRVTSLFQANDGLLEETQLVESVVYTRFAMNSCHSFSPQLLETSLATSPTRNLKSQYLWFCVRQAPYRPTAPSERHGSNFVEHT